MAGFLTWWESADYVDRVFALVLVLIAEAALHMALASLAELLCTAADRGHLRLLWEPIGGNHRPSRPLRMYYELVFESLVYFWATFCSGAVLWWAVRQRWAATFGILGGTGTLLGLTVLIRMVD